MAGSLCIYMCSSVQTTMTVFQWSTRRLLASRGTTGSSVTSSVRLWCRMSAQWSPRPACRSWRGRSSLWWCTRWVEEQAAIRARTQGWRSWRNRFCLWLFFDSEKAGSRTSADRRSPSRQEEKVSGDYGLIQRGAKEGRAASLLRSSRCYKWCGSFTRESLKAFVCL